MFKGCTNLSKLTLGSNWPDRNGNINDNVDKCGLDENVDNPWYFVENTKEGTTIRTQISLNSFPINQDNGKQYVDFTDTGTIERDPSKIAQQKITFVVNDATKGSISPSEDMNFVNSFSYSLNSETNVLKVNNTFITPTPIGTENKLKYWMVNGEKIEETGVHSKLPTYEGTDAEVQIKAVFGDTSNIPKAVYNETNRTLTFYDDKLDHSEEGLVMPIYDTGYTCVRDATYGTWTSEMKLPAWYYKLAKQEKAPGGEIAAKTIQENYASFGQQAEAIPTQVIADPKYENVYLGIDAETVIFDSSFKKYDELSSIACWFMADSTGRQPFKYFKSRTEDGNLVDGFQNVNTECLSHAEYAFGGFYSFEFESYYYFQGGKEPLVVRSVFDMLLDFGEELINDAMPAG
ncbi:MAG: hypothetical protein Q4F54_05050 [Coriobacteriia bacterium]|nr:hypothetical protein [Coriobacteriia bacterium]